MNSHNYDELLIVNTLCLGFYALFINYITKICHLHAKQNSHFRNHPF